jgi:predicted ATPase
MLYEDITDVDVSVEGGTVQVFLQEGRRTIPAARLSDGTLRWLVLLTILLHPNPPGLVCLEEPELGLHPDILPALTRLLREASSRMQLIVTTHSDSVADALTECPDAVVVCEKEEGSTTLRRLSRDVLSAWLKRYSLGELWRRGEIGGNRW